MTKRELEVAKRHRGHLVDLRDGAWQRVRETEPTTTDILHRHEALVYAIALVDAEIAAAEPPIAASVPVSTAA